MLVQCFDFINGKTRAQNRASDCPRSQNDLMSVLGQDSRSLSLQILSQYTSLPQFPILKQFHHYLHYSIYYKPLFSAVMSSKEFKADSFFLTPKPTFFPLSHSSQTFFHGFYKPTLAGLALEIQEIMKSSFPQGLKIYPSE